MSPAAALLDIYDDLAVTIVDDVQSNVDVNLSLSNQEIAELVCTSMGWEDFDLLGHFDFDAAEKSSDTSTVLAHAFISFLRWRLFNAAAHQQIGDQEFNVQCVAYSEYWYLRLIQKWDTMETGDTHKTWIC